MYTVVAGGEGAVYGRGVAVARRGMARRCSPPLPPRVAPRGARRSNLESPPPLDPTFDK